MTKSNKEHALLCEICGIGLDENNVSERYDDMCQKCWEKDDEYEEPFFKHNEDSCESCQFGDWLRREDYAEEGKINFYMCKEKKSKFYRTVFSYNHPSCELFVEDSE